MFYHFYATIFHNLPPPPCVQLCLETTMGVKFESVFLFSFSFEVARHICDDSYGLVFGFNTFLALFFQSILTLIVADDAGLALDPRTQVRTSRFKKLQKTLCLSVYPSICLSVRPSLRASVHLSVCLSICPSIRPSVCLT